ncbi:META domain-containing protein [Xenorhabdus cabanillasii]|uniref:Heat shock protein HslJ n=2 Tax=Xenorhabdus cabanillasii TaxID=351673 RepID=A0A3D9UGH0_9GAMM|nr:META domain-containing protein [Xenorhabdus cabanillasii]PHM78002.1 META domain-containing protein [Xenorhabdus cabanillasii JM26]REF28357.1 heat shock protein HslJ [Xenorhabdus cabanillasii]CDL87358.1 Heat shock protein hslJ [Xenorhabdus cabanillasii JM26]
MNRAIPLAVATLLLTACQSTGVSATGNITAKDLQHRNFALVSVNDEDVSNKEDTKLSITFGDKMFVSGTMCNNFMGEGKLKDNVLTISKLSSSQIFCVNEKLNKWDQVMVDILTQGARVSLKDKQLMLTNKRNKLVYTLKEPVQ